MTDQDYPQRAPVDPSEERTPDPAASGHHKITRLSYEQAGSFVTQAGIFFVCAGLAVSALFSIVVWLQHGYFPDFSLRKVLVWRDLGVEVNRYDWSEDVPLGPPITDWVGVQKIADYILDLHVAVHTLVVGTVVTFLGAGISVVGDNLKARKLVRLHSTRV